MSQQSSSDVGDFLLLLSGLKCDAPFLENWKTFKDHLRDAFQSQPGWTSISPSQRKEEMQGWYEPRDRTDADNIYVLLANGRVQAQIWEKGRTHERFRLTRCNCSSHSAGGHIWQCGIEIEEENACPTIYKKPPFIPETHLQNRLYTAQTTVSHTPTLDEKFYKRTPAKEPFHAATPVFSTSTSGIAVNMQGGGILTEAREIYIRQLNFRATWQDLHVLLIHLEPIHFKLLIDHKKGGHKGVAIAQFASKEAAHRAVLHLDGYSHMGMVLYARLGKETTPVGLVQPLIVNGGRGWRGK